MPHSSKITWWCFVVHFHACSLWGRNEAFFNIWNKIKCFETFIIKPTSFSLIFFLVFCWCSCSHISSFTCFYLLCPPQYIFLMASSPSHSDSPTRNRPLVSRKVFPIKYDPSTSRTDSFWRKLLLLLQLSLRKLLPHRRNIGPSLFLRENENPQPKT